VAQTRSNPGSASQRLVPVDLTTGLVVARAPTHASPTDGG
jgi:hypothetical protein